MSPERTTGREALVTAALELFAREGIGNTSLRQVAAQIGTSHRMLNYHFGSREGLLVAIVEELERRNSEALTSMTADDTGPLRARAWSFWEHAADTAGAYGPLFFELTSHAMQDKAHTRALAEGNLAVWLEVLTALWVRTGLDEGTAAVRARLNLAVARGLLHDLLLTGDRAAVDAAMAHFADLTLGPDDG